MKTRVSPCLLLGLIFVLSATPSALPSDGNDQGNNDHGNNDSQGNGNQGDNRNGPVSASSIILVPGNPITSADISWADPGTERYYFADRSNAGVEIIDAEKDVWVGRVEGMAGPLTS